MARIASTGFVSRCGSAFVCVCSSLVLLVFGARVAADTFEWTDPNSGNFLDAGNWNNTTGGDLAPPNTGDTALFNEAGTYTVTLTANTALDLLDVDAGTITFDSSGGTNTYDLLTGAADALFGGSDVILDGTNLNIGDDFSVADGTMMVLGGSDVTVSDVTSIATGGGNAEVTFDASSFDFGGLVRLALSGLDGTLNLTNGSTGNIDGDLDFVRSGTLGTGGFLNVFSDSSLTTNGRILLGDIISNGSPSYDAFLTVDDSTLTMNGANNLRVGDSQFDNVNAELRVRNGGTFETGIGGGNTIVQRTGLLALETSGTFTARHDLLVTQTGEITATSDAQLETESLLSIETGSSVSLSGGADLTATTVEVGDSDPNSMLSVSGSGTTAVLTGNLHVGDEGNGTLNVQNGGMVSNNLGFIGDKTGAIGTVNVDGTDPGGNPSTWTNALDLFVGDQGNGTLNITGGGTVSSRITVLGRTINAEGTVTVNGADSNGNPSTWANEFGLTVGESGEGTLNISEGGSVSNTSVSIGEGTNGVGTVTVDGTDTNGNPSTWTTVSLDVGQSGNGTMDITNGGMVSSSGFGVIAGGADSISTVTVDGTGAAGNPSTWSSSSSLRVGDAGDGTLNITAGGQVSNTQGFIGDDPNSTGMVTVDGTDLNDNASTWTNSGSIGVGNGGDGTLNITAGGQVSNTQGTIGSGSNSTGMVVVTGAGSTWTNSSDVRVGSFGDGTLNILGGGVVSNTTGTIADDENSTGMVTVDGTDANGNASTWTNTGDLFVGDGGNGTLNITNGGSVSGTIGVIGLRVDSDGTVTVSGTDGAANSSSLMISDQLTIGSLGKGTLLIQGGGSVSSDFAFVGQNQNLTTSTVTVDGSDPNGNPSTLTTTNTLVIGPSGVGTLTIRNGGEAISDAVTIGNLAGSMGTATVDGTDINGTASSWTTGGITIGASGTGVLNVISGAEVANSSGTIGRSAGSTGTVTVDGADSKLTFSLPLSVGGTQFAAGGNGTLNVQNSGLVQVDSVFKDLDHRHGFARWRQHCHSKHGQHRRWRLRLHRRLFDDQRRHYHWRRSVWRVPGEFLCRCRSPCYHTSNNHRQRGTHLGSQRWKPHDEQPHGEWVASLQQRHAGTNGWHGHRFATVDRAGEWHVAGNGQLQRNSCRRRVRLAHRGFRRFNYRDATHTSGFYSNGAVDVADNVLTILDANDAVLDSGAAVDLGSTGTGEIDAANGLTLDFGGNITGFGTVDTPDDPATPLINNGSITGNSMDDQITLTGYVKGVGTCDNCNITGTDAPGFSPAAVNRGSVSYNGTLEIEIGGASAGSDYDQLNHILGAGIATLGGVLDVQLIDDFAPQENDSFEIITAIGGVNGTFSTMASALPALSGNLEWEILYGSNNVLLSVIVAGLPGDFNNNGIVDSADYTTWLAALGSSDETLISNNGDGGGVGLSDYNLWKISLGNSAAVGVSRPPYRRRVVCCCCASPPVHWR